MKAFPDRVNLCGIGYRIQEREGLIVFSEDRGFWGCHSRIIFRKHDQIWYVSFSDTWKEIMASHIIKAYELVCEFRGKNFEDAPKPPSLGGGENNT